MRNALKIKTYTVILAWLVIFAHSIIPHNHPEEQYSEFKSSVHYVNIETGNEKDDLFIDSSACDHEKVCSFTSNLFHQLNSEDLLVAQEDNTRIINCDCLSFFLFYEKDQAIPDFILYPNSLRAPPAVG